MVDSLLGGLFGGPDGDRIRSEAKNFVERYDTGPKHEGYTNAEVARNFSEVAKQMSGKEVETAATKSIEQMTPQERRAYNKAMRERGVPQFQNIPEDSEDPAVLGKATEQFMAEETKSKGIDGALQDLYGKDSNFLDSPAVKAALAGVAAFAFKKFLDANK